MRKIIFILAFAFMLASCTNDDAFKKGKKQLENMGYTDVRSTGYTMFCCGDGDDYAEGFVAKGRNGDRVVGCICSGLFKGVTIRFE